ncbi:TetR/AcrR family transcriptional regulator [Nitrospirillum amazonense]|uniref:TetR/AcrR family transcriptional regulator n=1 Tax=Nitrospirillum amazonense TaxID=28077 RepID=UPI001B3BE40B|nr:TetR family transcriptional regulator [Nitrospirillum amazonense]
MSVRGLGGLTLGQLATASGLSKSGLFAHFRSKEQLQIDLLNEVTQAASRVVVGPAMLAAEGLPRLVAVMDHWLGWSRRAGLAGGCPVAAALFELDDVEGEVRAHAAKLEEEWRGQLRQLVFEAKRLSHLSGETDVDQFVWELCGIYLSHHVSSRFLRMDDADARAKTAVNALVERHRPPAVPAIQTMGA